MQNLVLNKSEVVDKFIWGFKNQTCIKVWLQRPTSLDEAIQVIDNYDSLFNDTLTLQQPQGNYLYFINHGGEQERREGPYLGIKQAWREGSVSMEIDAIK